MLNNEPAISLDRSICNNLPAALQREWLVTNGLGGYAMGTVAGVRTRSYHGLLVAAVKPPLGRMQLLADLEETATYNGETHELFANRWQSGEITPRGHQYIERFYLEGTSPVWLYRLGSALLEKRLWMQPGANTTYVRYTLLQGEKPVELTIKALVNYRDHHSTSRDTEVHMNVEQVEHGLRLSPQAEASPFYVLSNGAKAEPQYVWHKDLLLSAEAERGLMAQDNSLLAGLFHTTLQSGTPLCIVASTDAEVGLDGRKAHEERTQYEKSLIDVSGLTEAPKKVQQLVLAADQFIVRRDNHFDADGRSVIAGYPWFGDWGRDTMISLRGLTLETGRPEVTAHVLRTFAKYIDRGMLPNRFPDEGETPEYNTVDATLWYFQAINSYHEHTQDDGLLPGLFPLLEGIIDWHVKGTRHNIHVDPQDQLLYAGEGGTQLTWMDAKFGEHVVTPRIGKPVEVNALWYNALKIMADFASKLGADPTAYDERADQVKRSFSKFWNYPAGCCYDVLDGPNGHESLLRPNQILAVSLPYSPLGEAQQKQVVEACERALLTPYGLRSLAPIEPGYIGRYEGNTEHRDSAYHQGTVWAWLIGPFVDAYLRAYGNTQQSRDFLEPLLQQHLNDFGLGSVSEIFDGAEPFTARGCPWQAWSVAELLRAWRLTR